MAQIDHILFSKNFTVIGGNYQAAGSVSKQIKKILKQLNLDIDVIWRTMIVSYEAEMNVVLYAHEANVLLEISKLKIRLVFEDNGPGIPDIPLAMTEGFSTATREMRERGFGAGLGFPNIKKTADFFSIESNVGKGTKLDIGIKMVQ